MQILKYRFDAGKYENDLLEKLEKEIEQQLTVIPLEDEQAWKDKNGGQLVDCAKVTKGDKPDSVTYVCSTSVKVFNVMTSLYHASLEAHSPVNNIQAAIAPALVECSAAAEKGCRNSGHLHAHRCYYVTSTLPVPGIYCRHSPYTSTHGCF